MKQPQIKNGFPYGVSCEYKFISSKNNLTSTNNHCPLTKYNISLISSEFSASLCAPTLPEGVRVASRREAHLRLNKKEISRQFPT
ncbi:hypothetical protein CDG76_15255 [Nostoc sp. 'Peltigera membranacea cyanobiont' 210A]|uniref:hypothetical protein n=1 Tax=Nostoc sp. 'Peltigera membranacea cyanobiont' 210A TaxID=2014529 RepID=UPI000B95521F|nr:hypothetical protein [Nostoc sp. 'Peltigera membranacea cyanobiont' 210A]OYD94746.1 hypothetical protein CDG76_15255 [Nostoc sp. 'Peltigera membranacea cyanobiont' 210A]